MFIFLESVDLEQYPLISLRKITEELPLVSQKQQEKFSLKEFNSADFSCLYYCPLVVGTKCFCRKYTVFLEELKANRLERY